MYDNIGTVRGLVDASGTVTDTYELDTFGRSVSSTGTTPNPTGSGGPGGTSPIRQGCCNSVRGTTGPSWGGL